MMAVLHLPLRERVRPAEEDECLALAPSNEDLTQGGQIAETDAYLRRGGGQQRATKWRNPNQARTALVVGSKASSEIGN